MARRRVRVTFGTLGLILLAALFLKAPPAAAASINFGSPFQIISITGCLQENGTTDAVYFGGCSSNHSDYWTWKGSGTEQLVNYHSGLCLTASPDDTSVYMQTCGTNHVQYWDAELETGYGTYGDYNIDNVHFHGNYGCLYASGDADYLADCARVDPGGEYDSFTLQNV